MLWSLINDFGGLVKNYWYKFKPEIKYEGEINAYLSAVQLYRTTEHFNNL